ncbi:MAG TPA: hypothetical protein VKK79_07465 [Candidatus Lokiarchaeia archaeon]|nr:hypothetical protein [Candidatus Lokiarchaeia archaeon]
MAHRTKRLRKQIDGSEEQIQNHLEKLKKDLENDSLDTKHHQHEIDTLQDQLIEKYRLLKKKRKQKEGNRS